MRVLVAAVASAVLLAGCSGTASTTSRGTPSNGDVTVAPVQVSAPATTPVSLPPASPAPADAVFVTSASHGVKFALPKGWKIFDLTTFTKPEVRDSLAPIAKKLGKSVDDYIRELSSNNDLIVTGPERDGFAPSVSVRREAASMSDYVPTLEDSQSRLKDIGTVTAVDRLTTPLGLGYAEVYTRDDAGKTRYCALLALPSAKGTIFMGTVETDSAADEASLVTGIVTTLQPA